MTIWRMRISRQVPKATNTCSEYVIRLHERASMFTLYVHCLVCTRVLGRDWIFLVTLTSCSSLRLPPRTHLACCPFCEMKRAKVHNSLSNVEVQKAQKFPWTPDENVGDSSWYRGKFTPFCTTSGRFVFLARRDLKPYYWNGTKAGLISIDYICPLFAVGNIDGLSCTFTQFFNQSVTVAPF